MLKKKSKSIPKFETHSEEVRFWQTHKLVDYLDFDKRTRLFYQKNLVQSVTVRFSIEDLALLQKIAAKKGLGIATFIRMQMRKHLDKYPKTIRR